LRGQDADDAQTERLPVALQRIRRQTHAIVLHGQFADGRLGPAEGNPYPAARPAVEGVFQGIRQ
jgi:hypothetical protein